LIALTKPRREEKLFFKSRARGRSFEIHVAVIFKNEEGIEVNIE
jgi:hypothetical protein